MTVKIRMGEIIRKRYLMANHNPRTSMGKEAHQIITVMLTLAYSAFQGNVGTAYRQRAQLLVFYFIFVAVGFVLIKEKREEKKQRDQEERERLRKR